MQRFPRWPSRAAGCRQKVGLRPGKTSYSVVLGAVGVGWTRRGRDQGSPAIDPWMYLYVDFLRLGVTDSSRNEKWNPPSFYDSPPTYFLKAYCVSTPCWASRSSPSECVPGPRNALWPDVCPLLHPCLCRTLCSLEWHFPCSQTLMSYWLAHLSRPGLRGLPFIETSSIFSWAGCSPYPP